MTRKWCFVALLALTGCGSAETGRLQALDLLRGYLRGEGPAASTADQATVSRAELEGFPQALIRASLENRDVSALLVPVQAGVTGDITWRTQDDITLTFRHGLLVATRGLGGDLMSAAVPRLTQAPGQVERRHSYLIEDGRRETRTYTCTFTSPAPTNVTVLERTYPALRLEETCANAHGQQIFTNNYWVSSGGIVRKSRQWISDRAGYVTIERLIDG